MQNSDVRYFSKDDKDYVIRFFDCENGRDLRDLRLTVESPEAQRWMDNVDHLDPFSYRTWMDEKGGGNTFLFAIADPVDAVLADNRVHGFVYVYPSKIMDGYLEVSYAKRPESPKGLTAPAIETVIKYVYDFLLEKKPWAVSGLKFLAEIEKGNLPSIKVIERAGFVMIRDYDDKGDGLWAREYGYSLKGLQRVRQENGSYCGPAALQILLSHFGLATEQNRIVEAATTKEHVLKIGMSIELLAAAVKNLYPEMRLWAKRNSELSDLEMMVRKYNYPVGVNWQGIFEKNEYRDGLGEELFEDSDDEDSICKGEEGHYSVVIDADYAKNSVRMMDPYGHFSKEDRYILASEFLGRWWDDRMDRMPDGGKKYVYEKRLMFVVVPKNIRTPEDLGMTEI